MRAERVRKSTEIYSPEVPIIKKRKKEKIQSSQRTRMDQCNKIDSKWNIYRRRVKTLIGTINRESHYFDVMTQEKRKKSAILPPSDLQADEAATLTRLRNAKRNLRSLLFEIADSNKSHKIWPQLNQADDDNLVDVEDVMCSLCGQPDETNNDILLCDHKGCYRAYHQKCMEPPELEPNLNEDWFCRQCQCLDDCLEEINLCLSEEFHTYEDVFPEFSLSSTHSPSDGDKYPIEDNGIDLDQILKEMIQRNGENGNGNDDEEEDDEDYHPRQLHYDSDKYSDDNIHRKIKKKRGKKKRQHCDHSDGMLQTLDSDTDKKKEVSDDKGNDDSPLVTNNDDDDNNSSDGELSDDTESNSDDHDDDDDDDDDNSDNNSDDVDSNSDSDGENLNEEDEEEEEIDVDEDELMGLLQEAQDDLGVDATTLLYQSSSFSSSSSIQSSSIVSAERVSSSTRTLRQRHTTSNGTICAMTESSLISSQIAITHSLDPEGDRDIGKPISVIKQGVVKKGQVVKYIPYSYKAYLMLKKEQKTKNIVKKVMNSVIDHVVLNTIHMNTNTDLPSFDTSSTSSSSSFSQSSVNKYDDVYKHLFFDIDDSTAIITYPVDNNNLLEGCWEVEYGSSTTSDDNEKEKEKEKDEEMNKGVTTNINSSKSILNYTELSKQLKLYAELVKSSYAFQQALLKEKDEDNDNNSDDDDEDGDGHKRKKKKSTTGFGMEEDVYDPNNIVTTKRTRKEVDYSVLHVEMFGIEDHEALDEDDSDVASTYSVDNDTTKQHTPVDDDDDKGKSRLSSSSTRRGGRRKNDTGEMISSSRKATVNKRFNDTKYIRKIMSYSENKGDEVENTDDDNDDDDDSRLENKKRSHKRKYIRKKESVDPTDSPKKEEKVVKRKYVRKSKSDGCNDNMKVSHNPNNNDNNGKKKDDHTNSSLDNQVKKRRGRSYKNNVVNNNNDIEENLNDEKIVFETVIPIVSTEDFNNSQECINHSDNTNFNINIAKDRMDLNTSQNNDDGNSKSQNSDHTNTHQSLEGQQQQQKQQQIINHENIMNTNSSSGSGVVNKVRRPWKRLHKSIQSSDNVLSTESHPLGPICTIPNTVSNIITNVSEGHQDKAVVKGINIKNEDMLMDESSKDSTNTALYVYKKKDDTITTNKSNFDLSTLDVSHTTTTAVTLTNGYIVKEEVPTISNDDDDIVDVTYKKSEEIMSRLITKKETISDIQVEVKDDHTNDMTISTFPSCNDMKEITTSSSSNSVMIPTLSLTPTKHQDLCIKAVSTPTATTTYDLIAVKRVSEMIQSNTNTNTSSNFFTTVSQHNSPTNSRTNSPNTALISTKGPHSVDIVTISKLISTDKSSQIIHPSHFNESINDSTYSNVIDMSVNLITTKEMNMAAVGAGASTSTNKVMIDLSHIPTKKSIIPTILPQSSIPSVSSVSSDITTVFHTLKPLTSSSTKVVPDLPQSISNNAHDSFTVLSPLKTSQTEVQKTLSSSNTPSFESLVHHACDRSNNTSMGLGNRGITASFTYPTTAYDKYIQQNNMKLFNQLNNIDTQKKITYSNELSYPSKMASFTLNSNNVSMNSTNQSNQSNQSISSHKINDLNSIRRLTQPTTYSSHNQYSNHKNTHFSVPTKPPYQPFRNHYKPKEDQSSPSRTPKTIVNTSPTNVSIPTSTTTYTLTSPNASTNSNIQNSTSRHMITDTSVNHINGEYYNRHPGYVNKIQVINQSLSTPFNQPVVTSTNNQPNTGNPAPNIWQANQLVTSSSSSSSSSLSPPLSSSAPLPIQTNDNRHLNNHAYSQHHHHHHINGNNTNVNPMNTQTPIPSPYQPIIFTHTTERNTTSSISPHTNTTAASATTTTTTTTTTTPNFQISSNIVSTPSFTSSTLSSSLLVNKPHPPQNIDTTSTKDVSNLTNINEGDANRIDTNTSLPHYW